MTCERCDHQAAVRAGKYRGVAFVETPCGKCRWQERSSKFTIPFDERRAAATPVDGERPFPEEEEAEELKMPVSVMTAALAMIMALQARTRDALCDRYLGRLYREIADAQGVTMAAIEIRHKRALERWPELRALFPVKVAKQARRKPHRRAGGEIGGRWEVAGGRREIRCQGKGARDDFRRLPGEPSEVVEVARGTGAEQGGAGALARGKAGGLGGGGEAAEAW